MVWQVSNGQLTGIPVTTGLTDGQQTVVQGQGISAGMQIVIGAATGGAGVQTQTTTSPFQSQSRQGGGPRGL
jgi:hypothetical protein